MSKKIEVKIGDKYGRLEVVYMKPEEDYFVCFCDCGKAFKTKKETLLKRKKPSCGCWQVELTKQNNRTHGLSKTTEYKIYQGMLRRLKEYDKGYTNYGGRGIKICERWLLGEENKTGVECFIEDMGLRPTPKHSLERLDVDGDYTPDNCIWATVKEQNNNKTTTIRLTYKGETKALGYWADSTGIKIKTLQWRHRHGWTPEEILETPVPFITYKGETRKLKEWCDLLDLEFLLIKNRLGSGWSVERAFEEPKREN